MTTPVLTCLRCVYFSFIPGEPNWSETTPGESVEIACTKDWYTGNSLDRMTREEFRATLEQAATCPDFTEADR